MTDENKTLSEQIETEVVLAAEPQANQSLNSQIEKTRIRKKSYVMDLRIHSPASLGYLGVEGIDAAPALVRLAKVKGLDVIAVTDFYSASFIDKILHAARDTNLIVIPGVDLRCVIGGCDDVILSCLFPEHYNTDSVKQFLVEMEVPESAAGSRKFLMKKSFEEILTAVERHGGVCLPSRMDKTPYRMAAIPALVEQYGFRAFDLAYADTVAYFRSKWPKIKFQLFSFSNANALAQVGSRIARVKMPDPGFDGVKHLVARQG